jgi:lipoate---protein ligase
MGNAVFSFFNPISDFKDSNYKTMNNDVLIKTLLALGVPDAAPSGRNDIVIGDKKVSGSAYKLNLGKSNGMGRKALHHGTMMIDVDFR